MSRHRNVRTMKYEDEYFDDDDVYGHSVEDNYCISPGTAAQFTFNRDKDTSLSSFMDKEADIPEEDEDDGDSSGQEQSGLRNSLDYVRPTLNDIDNAKLNSCLEEVRNILGESLPEHVLLDTIVKHNFNLEASLHELLSPQDAPKPQREPRQNRRKRSQGSQQKDTTVPTDLTSQSGPPSEPVSVSGKSAQQSEPVKVSGKSAPSTQQSEPMKIKGPTVILKQPPKPKITVTDSARSASPVSISDRNLAEDLLGVERTTNKTADLDIKSDKANGSVNSSPEIDRRTKNAATGGGSSDVNQTPKKERFIPPLPRSSSKSKPEKIDLIAEYKKREGGKDMLNMVVIGHVDAGKSTMMGHVLYQLGSVNKRAMHKYEQESKKMGKGSFAYAWVLDETEEERTRGVTMDIAQTRFETAGKAITLLDAPGHKDFIPNMITGTAQADVAILVVNATKGEFETGFDSGGQTREHAILARSLGVSQLIVGINKMDTVNWSEARYIEIVQKLGAFLKQAGFKETDTAFIPVSGLSGENLVQPIHEPKLSAWYTGNTLAQQIDLFKPVSRPIDKPLRICVSDVFKGMGSGFSISGKIASGCVQNFERVLVLPAGEMAVVKGITRNDEAVGYAFSGDHVSVVITGIDITNVGVGSVLCDIREPMKCALRIRARVVLFNLEIPMTRGFTVIFHYQSITEPAVVKRLVSQLNKSTGEVVKNKPKCLTKNMSAVIEIEFDRPVCLELYKDYKELGRFMLRYSGHTIAAGLVEEVLKTKSADSQGASAY